MSKFKLNSVYIEDYKLIESGSIISHKDEIRFTFEVFTLKIEFKTDKTKDSELDFDSDSAVLRCYNLNNNATVEPYELARIPIPSEQIPQGALSQTIGAATKLLMSWDEVLYIAFSTTLIGNSRAINYSFFTRIISRGFNI